MKYILITLPFLLLSLGLSGCQNDPEEKQTVETEPTPAPSKISVILDTDANNELDDQHAMAYLLFNADVFDILGITVNRTKSGGTIEQQMEEAERVLQLCASAGTVNIYKGADLSFDEIKAQLGERDFDGADAVNFIIEQAQAVEGEPLVLLPIGKLTNIALAVEKAPEIAQKIRVVWLGSNYPEPGEYNQDNDPESLNYLLDTQVPFEIVTVRYGDSSGTDAVRVTPAEVADNMAGKGPQITAAVVGRHAASFHNFGDYAVNLFQNIDLQGDPPARALFDMVAVAIVKNPAWAQQKEIPAPILVDGKWEERPENPRKIIIWEYFNKEEIMADFYGRMTNYVLP